MAHRSKENLPPPARRTPSFSSPESSFRSSSSSLSLSSNEDHLSPLITPSTKGIPFSWEQLPGIPKHQVSNSDQPAAHLLPLPPAGNPISAAKKTARVERDPFTAALVACSKDHDQDQGSFWREGLKITRLGFINMYASCKKTCAVSESIVYLPRSSPQYLVGRRSR